MARHRLPPPALTSPRKPHLQLPCYFGIDHLVGVCMKRSPEVVIAMLGVLKVGGAYVPIDPSYPKRRIDFILSDASAGVVLTDSSIAERLPEQVRFIPVDTDAGAPGRQSVDNAVFQVQPDDTAYVIYTSGSTGQPKGVVVSHRSLGNYVCWARRRYVGSQSLAFPFFSSLSFDLTVTSVFVSLVSGGRIVVYPEPEGGADLALLDVIEEDVVDVLKLTPSHLALIKDQDLSGSRIRRPQFG